MSKKTIIFSIVLILVGATIFESRILSEEELMQAETVATTSSETMQVAETATQDSVEMQEWVISAYDEMMRGTLTRIYERFWRLLPMAKGYTANMPVTLGVCPPSVAEYMEMFRRERKNAGVQG